MRKLQLIALLCLSLISSQSTSQERSAELIPYAGTIRVAVDTADWSTMLFSFEYTKDLERTAEASMAEISRLDSIRLFMEDLLRVEAAKLEQAKVVREALEDQLGMTEKEVKRQRRGKIWGSVGAFLAGTGFGAIVGWVASR
jgi:hypothetical protein